MGRAGATTSSLIAVNSVPFVICSLKGLSRTMIATDMRIQPIAPHPESMCAIVFFDGVCGLCNSFVDFTLARDRGSRFRFSPLQGETFTARLGPPPSRVGETGSNEARLASIVFWDGEQAHMKSEAVLRVVECLGGGWLLARPLRLVPRILRDTVYDFVAKNRYRWFGKRETCRLPSDTERERFLP